MCVFMIFFSNYKTSRSKKGNNGTVIMEFHEDHPSYDNLYLVEREKPAVPCVNYLDFPDTKKFVGTCC